MFQSLIVGFGRAGKQLHLRCLRKARNRNGNDHLFGNEIGVVDPILASVPADRSIHSFTSLAEVTGFDPASTVVHICTPPAAHLDAIRQVSELGYTLIIVEKPLATSMPEVEIIRQLESERHLNILVIAVWLSSTLTEELKNLVDSNRLGPLKRLVMEQHKPRMARTLKDSGHTTAFDVELPHQLALALYLGGEGVEVVDASCTDMRMGSRTIPYMGTARMRMRHDGGLQSELFSDLTAQTRERVVKLEFETHAVEGYFPASQNIHHSQLTLYNSGGHVLESRQLEDDPLTRCFTEYYTYYAHGGEKPISDLQFNTILMSAIMQAKMLSGIPTLVHSKSQAPT